MTTLIYHHRFQNSVQSGGIEEAEQNSERAARDWESRGLVAALRRSPPSCCCSSVTERGESKRIGEQQGVREKKERPRW